MLYRQFFALVTLSALIAGCGGGGLGNGPLPGQNEPDVRVFNGVFGQSAITATFKDTSLNFLGRSTSAAYGGTSNDTILTNVPLTATINGSSGALVTSAPTLVRIDSFYTAFAGGNAAGNYTAFILADSQSIAPHHMVGLRAVHLGANTAPVDVYFTNNGVIDSTTLIFSNVSYSNVSNSSNSPQAVDADGYLTASVNSGSNYSVIVTAHGSLTPIVTTQVFPTQTDYYTIAIYDTAGGVGTSASVIIDTRQS